MWFAPAPSVRAVKGNLAVSVRMLRAPNDDGQKSEFNSFLIGDGGKDGDLDFANPRVADGRSNPANWKQDNFTCQGEF